MSTFVKIYDEELEESIYVNSRYILTIRPTGKTQSLIETVDMTYLVTETPDELMHRIQLATKYSGNPA